jgi:hypothetical protein
MAEFFRTTIAANGEKAEKFFKFFLLPVSRLSHLCRAYELEFGKTERKYGNKD